LTQSGKEVLTGKFSWTSAFENGRALVSLNGKFGWIDTTGRAIAPFIYDHVRMVSPSVYYVAQNGEWKFVDSSVQSITTSRYDKISAMDYNSLSDPQPSKYFKTKKGQYWGIADATGHDIVLPIYEEIEMPSENLFRIKTGNGYQLINAEGKVLTVGTYSAIGFPQRFSVVHHYSQGYGHSRAEMRIRRYPNGIIWVQKGGFEGYIDLCGDEIIPCMYTDISEFSKGLAMVKSRDKFGFVNLAGATVINCVYDYAEPFDEDRALVQRNGKYGFIDRSGKEIIPLIYDSAQPFRDGKAYVVLDQDYFPIDKQGNRINQ